MFIGAPPPPQELPPLVRRRRVVRAAAGGPGAPDRPGRRARSATDPARVPSHPGAPDPRPRRMGLPGPVPDHAIARTMAHTPGTTPRLQRLSALVAIALVAIAVGFAFGRILVGHGATYRMIAVGLASGVLAWATERRGMLAGHARERRGPAARRHLARGPPRHVARAADADHASGRSGRSRRWSASRPASTSPPRRRRPPW